MSINLNFSVGFFIYHISLLSCPCRTAITTTFLLAYVFSWSEIVCFCGSTAPSSLRSKPALPVFMKALGEDIIGSYFSFSSSWDLRGPVRLCACSSCNTFISLSWTYCISTNTTVLLTEIPWSMTFWC